MRKKCRSLTRTRGKRVLSAATKMVPLFGYAQESERWREWVFRTISLEKAERKVARGEADRVVRRIDGVVQVVGYRATKPARASRPSATTLTMATLSAVSNAAQDGVELSWSEERHVAKFLLWPFEHDRKNPATVGPRVTAVEEKRAMRQLGLATAA